jgi:DNA polymerase III subunit alpha
MSFCHLHLHSHYSLLDGANRISDLISEAKKQGMPAIALTDHGNMFGAVQFHDAAQKAGIKPIIGCELYVARNGRKLKSGGSAAANHMILLAKDNTGYHNLVKLVSLGYLEGFYYRPRIDKTLLAKHSEGLICLTACIQGIVPQLIIQNKYDAARKEAKELLEIFGQGNFYLELQDHGIEEQRVANEGLIKLSKELDIPLVATNDCHYLKRTQSKSHDALLCIQTGKKVSDTNRMSYQTDEFFLKTEEEMQSLFSHIPEALSNTMEIAEKCNFSFGPTKNIFPDFECPEGYSVDTYFEKIARDGFEKRKNHLLKLKEDGRLLHSMEEYDARLSREIKIIQEMQFSAYFLIVWDFMDYARETGVPVGPGRGSAAGSLVSYSMGITDVDPLAYDLLFERFLNPERVTPPDIDIDFCMLRRNEVIEYVTKRYGRDNVSHIITFGSMKAKQVIRDVGRVLDFEYAVADKVAKLIPTDLGTTLTDSLANVKELKDLARDDKEINGLIQTALDLEGLARHSSTHAAGVVIAPKPLIELVPLHKDEKKNEISTQYQMSDLERLGLLKMDFLGLTTLTVLSQVLEQIKDLCGLEIVLEDLPLDDPDTFKLFCEGNTAGVFQFESSGMRDILKRLHPSRIEDLIALNALYRPGPIKGGMIDEFIKRRHGEVEVTYDHPELEGILKETYGVIVYQEQVMRIASQLANFTLGGADILRRAMGKKKISVMDDQRKKFMEGSAEKGINKATAKRVFDLMEKFAGYGFNKSHSAAYALLAYQTAYLKAHYPVQFMAAVLTNELFKSDCKIVQYMEEAREMSIRVLPPDVNKSGVYFLGTKEGEIIFGLSALKNAGENAVTEIVESRKTEGPYRDLFHFCESVDLRKVNRRVIEALIKAGAFDSLGQQRKSLFEAINMAIERGQNAQRDKLTGQQGLFTDLADSSQEGIPEPVPDQGEWEKRELLSYEKEVLGYYLTGHPMEQYREELKNFSRYRTSDLDNKLDQREITIGGMIAKVERKQTRKGGTMAILQLEDLAGSIEVILWPNFYEKNTSILASDNPVLVKGKLEVNDRDEIKLIAFEICDLVSRWQNGIKKAIVRIPLEKADSPGIAHFEALVRRFPGSSLIEFEIYGHSGGAVSVNPREELRINAVPEFVSSVEKLFGSKSCILETN